MTMTQIKMPPTCKQYVEPEFIPPNSDTGATLALWPAALDLHRTQGAGIEIFGVFLFAPALVAIAAVILVALLGYFVVWLCFVGVLLAGLVIADRVIG